MIQFVGLVDKIDSPLNLPKVLGGDVVTSSTEFTLEANASWVQWVRVDVVPRDTALWAGVIVAVTEVARAVIEPTTNGVDQDRWIKFVDSLSKSKFWVVGIGLAPAFVVDDLEDTTPLATCPRRSSEK